MRWSEVDQSLCPVARASAIVGDRWTLLILRELLQGERRFDAIRRRLDVSPHLLSVRLRRLVQEGLLERGEGDYRLTEAGLDLQPVILALLVWGNRWRQAPEGPAARLLHRDCGGAFDQALRCGVCGETAGARNVATEFSPALIREREAPEARARRATKASCRGAGR